MKRISFILLPLVLLAGCGLFYPPVSVYSLLPTEKCSICGAHAEKTCQVCTPEKKCLECTQFTEMKNHDCAMVFSVVNDPEKIFNTVAYDSAIKAAANVKGTANIEWESLLKAVMLAERMDQSNTQTLILAKAAFLGLNANPSSKENRDSFWKAIHEISQISLSMRALISSRSVVIDKLEKGIRIIANELPSLEASGLKSDHLKSELRLNLDQLDAAEIAMPLEGRSPARAVAKSILEYDLKNYEYVVRNLPTKESFMLPEQYYILASALLRQERLEDATKVVGTFESIATAVQDPRLVAKSFNLRGAVKMKTARPLKDLSKQTLLFDEAIEAFQKALKTDPTYVSGDYNIAACVCLSGGPLVINGKVIDSETDKVRLQKIAEGLAKYGRKLGHTAEETYTDALQDRVQDFERIRPIKTHMVPLIEAEMAKLPKQ